MDYLSSLFSLSGKTALVTGSSRGLGLVLARGLARAGARVVLNGRDETVLASAADRFRAEGLEVSFSAFDVTDSGGVDEGKARIERETGPVG